MRLRLTLEYVTKTSRGTGEYRRVVPKELRVDLGKREFKKVLGKTEAQALKAYPQYHRSVEEDIQEALKPNAVHSDNKPTPLEDFKSAVSNLRNWGIDPAQPIHSDPDGDPDSLARDALIEQIASKYPMDADGYPEVSSQVDAMMIQLLSAGLQDREPRSRNPRLKTPSGYISKRRSRAISMRRRGGNVQSA
jgi:hypothetical protein